MSQINIDIFFDFLVARKEKDCLFTLSQLKGHFRQIGLSITDRQVCDVIGNFKKLGLLKSLRRSHYKIKKNEMDSFYRHFKKGKVKLWYRKTKREEGADTTKAFGLSLKARALISTLKRPFVINDLLLSPESRQLNLNYKAFANMIQWFGDDFEVIGENKHRKVYQPKSSFFKRFEKEKSTYIKLLPHKKEAIEKAFKDLKPMPKTVTHGVVENHHAPKPGMIIKSIFSAYEKPLAISDIEAIGKKYGFELRRTAINWHVNVNTQSIVKDGMRGNAHLYIANENFFKVNAKYIDEIVRILPDKKSAILSRFNRFCGQIKPDTMAKAEQVGGPDSEFEKDMELIDAANVGAAILSYVSKLQKRIKEQPGADLNEMEQIRKKYLDSQQTIIGLQSKVQSLENSVANLKQMIETNNQKIIDLNHENSILKNKAQAES